MATCEKCKKEEASFNKPKKLCNGCWFDWFTKEWVWEADSERTMTRDAFITNKKLPTWP